MSFQRFSFYVPTCFGACLSVYRYLQKPERALNSSEPELVTVMMECGCWESNSGLLEEQQMFLTAEPFFQPLVFIFIYKFSFIFSAND